jgi:hypothetical protein
MSIIALVQIFYLIVHKKYKAFIFFCIIGLVLHLFIKNISIVLILDIIITNILMKTVIKREGLDNMGATGILSDEKKKNEPEASEAEAFNNKTKSTPKTTQSENFSNLDKVNNTMDRFESIIGKFEGLTSKLGMGNK